MATKVKLESRIKRLAKVKPFIKLKADKDTSRPNPKAGY